MTSQAPVPTSRPSTWAAGEWPAADRLRWVLLVCWLLLLTYAVAFAERPGSVDQLLGRIDAGQVQRVEVGPPALPAGAIGSGTQQLHWRTGPVRRRATVDMRTSRSGESVTGDPVAGLRRGRDVAPRLRAFDPHLSVTRTSASAEISQLFGWYVPGWLGLGSLGLVLLTLWLLVSGPLPWRATRWAWFWLMATPVGVLAFLALSGRTPGVPLARPTRPALRGGLALVIAVLSASVLPTWWAA